MTYSDIFDKVSKELNLPKSIVEETYKSYWKFIKTHIEALPLKEDISEENFNKLRTNFNIPSLGKLYVTWDKVLKSRKQYNIIKKNREKNNAKG